jgi:A-factor biosynthesis hotdog domain
MNGTLSFDSTVPRALVHRAAISEVFVTDVLGAGDGRFRIGLQLPRAHSVHTDGGPPYHDLLLGCEAARQASALIAHRFYGVPHGHAFIFGTLDTRMEDPEAFRIGSAPAHVALDVDTEQRFRHGALARQRLLVRGSVDGVPCLAGEATAVYMAGTRYAALRARARRGAGDERPPRPVPAAPAAVGRHHPRNVVISDPVPTADGTVFAAGVIVDEDHPVFFDHPLDHIPAMLILEAFRQTAVAAIAEIAYVPAERVLLTGVQARFRDFAELTEPAQCVATVDTSAGSDVPALQLELSQRAAVRADARMEFQLC